MVVGGLSNPFLENSAALVQWVGKLNKNHQKWCYKGNLQGRFPGTFDGVSHLGNHVGDGAPVCERQVGKPQSNDSWDAGTPPCTKKDFQQPVLKNRRISNEGG
jgi:hypothetical protein